MTMEREELHDLLERLWDRYDREEFISADPIAVPHRFASRDDREIAGFLAATIAWGSRPMIVRNGLRMMHFLDDAPHDFVRNASERELAKLSGFVHRTFNGGDLIQFVRSIRAICERHGGLGRFVEASYASTGDMRRVLAAFREEFFRTEKQFNTDAYGCEVDPFLELCGRSEFVMECHTHPDLGVFWSAADRRSGSHRAGNKPLCIFVCDPVRGEMLCSMGRSFEDAQVLVYERAAQSAESSDLPLSPAGELTRLAGACLRTRGYEGSLRMHATLRGRTCLKLRLVMPKGRREGQP